MINKILAAIENAPQNNLVFDSALSLAQTTNASLMLLHVINQDESGYPILPTYTYYPMVDDIGYEIYEKKLSEHKQRGLHFLQTLTDQATQAGVKTEYSQLIGNPGRNICELAASWNADLILVGSRGLKGLKEMFLGSVSNYVTHHAPCSVLIVRYPFSIDREANADLDLFIEKENVRE
jgi:nucleotide-binding universal stress UspA family protein